MFDEKPGVRPKDEQREVSPAPQADVEESSVEPGTDALAQGFAKLRHRGMMRRDDSGVATERRTVPVDSAQGRLKLAMAGVHSLRAAAGRLDGDRFVPLVRLDR